MKVGGGYNLWYIVVLFACFVPRLLCQVAYAHDWPTFLGSFSRADILEHLVLSGNLVGSSPIVVEKPMEPKGAKVCGRCDWCCTGEFEVCANFWPGRSFSRLQASYYACQAVYLCHCCLHGGSFPGLQASRGHFQSCNLQVEAAIQRRAWRQNQRGPQGEHEPADHSFAGSRRKGREFFRPFLSKAIERVCFPACITGVCRKIEACHSAGRRAERLNLLRHWSISQPQRHQLVLLSTEAPFHHSFLILGLKEPPDQDVFRCGDCNLRHLLACHVPENLGPDRQVSVLTPLPGSRARILHKYIRWQIRFW